MKSRLVLVALCIVACGSPSDRSENHTVTPSLPQGAAAVERPEPAATADLGDGFVIWESDRSGAWRLWTRRLDGTGLRQLTADEQGRSHCCPHIAPDGSLVAYLSVERRAREYPAPEEAGSLRVVRPDGADERSVGVAARTYFENRAVVWRSPHELIYIDASGRTARLDIRSGVGEALVEDAVAEYGWLVDATLRWSVSGRSLFGRFDLSRRQVVPGPGRTGCQPYFTHDGRWGFWVAAPGGPINAVELASGRATTILRKSDPRLPSGLGYLYFPMFSADRRLLAFAASADEHDHFRADYEVFVAPTDPETLELVGGPVRLTSNPATDRFPDVHLTPLPLGRLVGEAPFTVRLEPEGVVRPWRWSFGDGATVEAAVGEHTFETPGSYAVEARRRDHVLRGRVVVAPPAAPRIVAARLRGLGDSIGIDFDEAVGLAEPSFALASGVRIESWSLSADGRSLTLELADRLRSSDRLQIDGIVDRAQVPNRMSSTEVTLEPPLWPSDRAGLVFLWETGEAPNLVYDPTLGAERAGQLEGRGRARLDSDFAMVLAEGAFTATEEQSNGLRWALQATNELTLELTLTSSGADGRIVSFSSGGRGENLRLEESAGRLLFGLRRGSRGRDAVQTVDIARLEAGRRTHLVLSYAPGRLHAWIDGELRTSTDVLQAGFFHWRSYRLTFGDEWAGGADWRGHLEGVAIYDRAMDGEEARENFLRYQEKTAERPRPQRLVVDVRLQRVSRVPTLAEITPYREALAVLEYELERVVEGEYERSRLRVADWVIADGERLRVPATGARRRLVLEPFSSQRQLASVYLADTLGEDAGEILFYAVAEH